MHLYPGFDLTTGPRPVKFTPGQLKLQVADPAGQFVFYKAITIKFKIQNKRQVLDTQFHNSGDAYKNQCELLEEPDVDEDNMKLRLKYTSESDDSDF